MKQDDEVDENSIGAARFVLARENSLLPIDGIPPGAVFQVEAGISTRTLIGVRCIRGEKQGKKFRIARDLLKTLARLKPADPAGSCDGTLFLRAPYTVDEAAP